MGLLSRNKRRLQRAEKTMAKAIEQIPDDKLKPQFRKQSEPPRVGALERRGKDEERDNTEDS